jgi:hypothetical protein
MTDIERLRRGDSDVNAPYARQALEQLAHLAYFGVMLPQELRAIARADIDKLRRLSASDLVRTADDKAASARMLARCDELERLLETVASDDLRWVIDQTVDELRRGGR